MVKVSDRNPPTTRRAHERHKLGALSWLRASVLGANDGIVSISSLILGVAAAHASHADILLSGIAALVAGAMSMAVGEYVSVHSQADSEAAALAQERAELESDPVGERHELTDIYRRRGLSTSLAREVAEQLTAHDALAAHAQWREIPVIVITAKQLTAAERERLLGQARKVIEKGGASRLDIVAAINEAVRRRPVRATVSANA